MIKRAIWDKALERLSMKWSWMLMSLALHRGQKWSKWFLCIAADKYFSHKTWLSTNCCLAVNAFCGILKWKWGCVTNQPRNSLAWQWPVQRIWWTSSDTFNCFHAAVFFKFSSLEWKDSITEKTFSDWFI